MKETARKAILTIVSLTICAVALSAAHYIMNQESDEPVPENRWTVVRCVLDMSEAQEGKSQLITGYSYCLLESFLKSQGYTPEISLRNHDSSPLDSLRNGSLEILCVPAGCECNFHGLIASKPVDDNCRWIMNLKDKDKMAAADDWIREYNGSAKRDSLNRRFMSVRRTKEFISPYDSLIKASAARNNLDWRLLAAVIHHESRFHIEAISRAGALGLSQLIPSTASRYGAEDALNPEFNIEGGAKYLRHLLGIYSRLGGQEKINFALAAYNGGPGNVNSCKDYADSIGLDRDSWADVQSAILAMCADSLNTVGDSTCIKAPAKVNWMETANYVSSVMSTYYMFRNMYPAE